LLNLSGNWLKKEDLMSPTEMNPYPGLEPFGEENRSYFFGRERDQKTIAANLTVSPLTILYGASGVGKTSVLQAGVMPFVEREPYITVTIFSEWQDGTFLESLKRQIVEKIGKRASVAITPKNVKDVSLDDLLKHVAQATGGTVAVILDQFEEYFLYHPKGQDGNQFETEFARAVNRDDVDANFILSMREDGIASLDRFQSRIPALFNNYLRLEHLDREGAERAIRKPLDRYNRDQKPSKHITVEDELVRELVNEAKTVGQAVLEPKERDEPEETEIETPILQLVMRRLWEKEKVAKSRVLRLDTLKTSMGGVRTVVYTHVNDEMDHLRAREQKFCALIFDRLVTPTGGKIAYPINDLVKHAGEPEEIVKPVFERLAIARILRSVAPPPGQPDVGRYEIFHDVLAQAVMNWKDRYLQDEAGRRRNRLLFALAIFLVLVIGGVSFLGGVQTQLSDARRANTAAAFANGTATVALSTANASYSTATVALSTANASYSTATVALSTAKAAYSTATVALSTAKAAQSTAEVAQAEVIDRQKAALASQALIFLDTNPKLSSLLGVEAYLQDPGLVSLNSVLKIVQAQTQSGVFVTVEVAQEQFLLERKLHVDSGSTLAIAFSPDENSLASSSSGNEGQILIWDLDSGNVSKYLNGHKYTVHDLDFSPDGDFLISGGSDNKVFIWNLQDDSHQNFEADGWILSVAISPDGKIVAAGSADNRIYIYREQDGKFEFDETLDEHINDVNDIEFFEMDDVLMLASASADNSVRLWKIGVTDSDESELLNTLWDIGAVFDVEISLDKELIAASGFEEIAAEEVPVIMLWDLQGKPLGAPLRGHDLAIFGIAFNHDGSQLVSSSADTSIRIWDPDARAQIGILDSGGNWVFEVDFRPKGDPMLASASRDISLWAPPEQLGEPLGEFLTGINGAVNAVSFSPESMIFAIGGGDGVLRLWDADTPLQSSFRELKGHTGAILGLDFSTSVTNTLIATGGEDGFVYLWSLFEDTPVLVKKHSAAVNSVVFSPDGDLVASASDDGTVQLWSVDDGNGTELVDAEVCQTFAETEGCGQISDLAISRDGRFLAVVTSNIGPIILDLDEDRKFRLELSDQTTLQTTVVAFNEDATILVAGSKNGQIVLWDIKGIRDNKDGQLLGILEPARGTVTSLTFNPNHNYLASSNEDGSIIFWDIDTREMIGEPFDLHSNTVMNVAFSPDGRFMVSGDSDGQVIIWDVSIDKLLALACSYAGRNFTRSEWNQYILTGEAYRFTCMEYPIDQLTPTPTPTPRPN
jgi:WD40 repeat protein